MESEDLQETNILTEDVDLAVRAAASGNLTIGIDEKAEGVSYQETLRHLGDTTYIVRIINDQKHKSTQPLPLKVSDSAGIQTTKNTGVVVSDVGTTTMRPEGGTIEKPTQANSIKDTITSETKHIQSVSLVKKAPKVTNAVVKGKKTTRVGSSMPAVSRIRRRIKKPEKLKDTDYVHPRYQAEKTITLPRLTKSNLSVNDLYIEIDVDSELFVSALKREYLKDGSFRYTFRISAYDFEGAFWKRNEETVDKTEVKKEPKSPVLTGKTPSHAGSVKGKKGRPRKAKLEKSLTPKSKDKIQKETVVKNLQDDQKLTEEETLRKEGGHTENVPETDYTESSHLEKAINDLAGILSTGQEIDKKGKTEEEYNEEIKGEHQESFTGNDFQADSADVADLNEQVEPIRGKKKEKEKSEDEAPERKKRKYTKRNAYSQDATNYTVKKLENGSHVYKCNFCGIELKYHGNMRDHLRTHTKETPFVCPTCGKGFTNQSNFNHHLPIHSEERPYVCELCGFAFKIRQSLKLHIRRHTSQGSHTCHYCGKRFHSSTELNNHIVYHTGEKNFECKVCKKKFTQSSALARHRFIHTGGGRHMCHLCGAVFARKEYYRSHLKKSHGDQAMSEGWIAEDIQKETEMKKDKEEEQSGEYKIFQYEFVEQPTYLIQIENIEDTIPQPQNEVEIATNKASFIMAGDVGQ